MELAKEQSPPQPEEPVTSIENDNPITEEQWGAMMDVTMAIYDFREADDHDPSRLFHRSVNKRIVPDYYDIIKEPMALSILKQRINKREYKAFSQFVRDCALIPHNAQTYNRPKSQAYEDALVIKDVFGSELKKIAEQGIITAEEAVLPDLGEIPEADPLPDEDEDEDDDDAEGEEDDDDSDDDGRRRKKPGPKPGAKRGPKDSQKNEADPRKKRGRPPRVDTPMETRIKAILKGIRKFKGPGGHLKISHFERLPDKAAYPDYYVEIKEPIAIDIIKRKSKRKKYNSVDHFMRDLDLMFNNAKEYNQSDSQIYQDAMDLQTESRKLAEQEKKKPDSEYLMEDGRFPLPDGILHRGELWKVGDWVHIQNTNDVSKPIVAQIYRTWQDSEGEKWINACWYYRPEQTVHHFEKHFYPNEVVKTGQYRDHRVDEIVDRCFVMFFTRYSRGRPLHLAPDKEIYVCEARYNEEKHKLNKIKTWASCLPDEVREKDYEMHIWDVPQKIKKVPSPIKHLLKNDAKETDDLPRPTWGADNAPPVVGAVHRRPRDENESPPPEPTPSPPPPASIPLPQQQSQQMPSATPRQSMSQSHPGAGMGMGAMATPQLPTASPAAPIMPQAAMPVQAPAYQSPMNPQMYQGPNPRRPSNFLPQTPVPYQASPAPHAYAQPSPYTAQQFQQPHRGAQPQLPPQQLQHQQQQQQHHQHQPQPQHPQQPQQLYNPNAPRPFEVYHLTESANAAIPQDIRNQFHTNESGQILFFTTPPLDIVPQMPKLTHSLKYLAKKAERGPAIAAHSLKRKEDALQAEQGHKRRCADEESTLVARVESLVPRALGALSGGVSRGTDLLYEGLYEGDAGVVREVDERVRGERIVRDRGAVERSERIQAESEISGVNLKGDAMYLGANGE